MYRRPNSQPQEFWRSKRLGAKKAKADIILRNLTLCCGEIAWLGLEMDSNKKTKTLKAAGFGRQSNVEIKGWALEKLVLELLDESCEANSRQYSERKLNHIDYLSSLDEKGEGELRHDFNIKLRGFLFDELCNKKLTKNSNQFVWKNFEIVDKPNIDLNIDEIEQLNLENIFHAFLLREDGKTNPLKEEMKRSIQIKLLNLDPDRIDILQKMIAGAFSFVKHNQDMPEWLSKSEMTLLSAEELWGLVDNYYKTYGLTEPEGKKTGRLSSLARTSVGRGPQTILFSHKAVGFSDKGLGSPGRIQDAFGWC